MRSIFSSARRCFSRAERFLPKIGKNTCYRVNGLCDAEGIAMIQRFFSFFVYSFSFARNKRERINKKEFIIS